MAGRSTIDPDSLEIAIHVKQDDRILLNARTFADRMLIQDSRILLGV